MKYAIQAPSIPTVTVAGTKDVFPVHRIYCVGRNYEEHAREMGKDPNREKPFFFMKPADAIVENNATIPYPPSTENFHHEIELVVAIGKSGVDIPEKEVTKHIYGYAVGNDLTRRDLQVTARKQGRPWDTGKSFDLSAPISAIHRATETGYLTQGHIWLKVNGEQRQSADLKDLIWNVNEIVSILSGLYTLLPGDLIYTGTPAGVGPIVPGDVIEGYIEGLDTLITTIRSEP